MVSSPSERKWSARSRDAADGSGGITKEESEGAATLKPGPYAKESIPAGGSGAGVARRLRAMCKRGADVRFVFERASDLAALESRYRDAGLELSARAMALDEARALPTTWAKKLGCSGGQRTFWDFRGTAVEQAMLEW